MFLDRRFFFIVYLYTQVVTETNQKKLLNYFSFSYKCLIIYGYGTCFDTFAHEGGMVLYSVQL